MASINKIPDRDAVLDLIKSLKIANRSGISLRKMMTILLHNIGIIPTCEGVIHKGMYILRARINTNETLFNSEKELSYRPDDWAVRSYGRASAPVRAVFYGVLGTEGREAAIETVLSEIKEIFRNTDPGYSILPQEFACTIAAWKVIHSINVAQVIFSKRYVDKIEWVNAGFNHFIENFESKLKKTEVESIKLIMEFISDEFSKPDIQTHEDYIISAAYAQYVFEDTPLNGVTYPSVKTNGHGVNVALYPSVVDRYTALDEVNYCYIKAKKDEIVIIPHKRAVDFGPFNSSFVWEDNFYKNST
jgi:hypothetical protein